MAIKIILYIATSLDGFIAKKDGSVKWLDRFNGEEYEYNKFLETIDCVVMGNTTYRQILGFGEFPYKNKKCFVFSNQSEKDNKVTFINEDTKQFVDSLVSEKNHNLWLVGGANLFNQFLKNNLIDEFRIFVMPTILGEGIRLFGEDNPESSLVLKKTKAYESGVVEFHYIKEE